MFLSSAEFASKIGLSVATIDKYVTQGFIKPHHYSVGGNRKFTEEQVQEFFDMHKDVARGRKRKRGVE